jgi:8-oxo-dGTP pyrophosphatase MutT (NUDIX family)
LLYPLRDEPHVLLTLRDVGLQHHGGQVSLPGGSAEPGESHVHAALREAREEVGVDPALVRVLGPLSPLHVPVSRFVIHPWVGCAETRPPFEPDPREVSRLIEVPLAELRDARHQRIERRSDDGQPREIPYFAVAGERVWGATAMIVAELLCVLGAPPEPRDD